MLRSARLKVATGTESEHLDAYVTTVKLPKFGGMKSLLLKKNHCDVSHYYCLSNITHQFNRQ